MTIHSNDSHSSLARKHFVAGRITYSEYLKCLRLDLSVTKTTIMSIEGEERLYPNRAADQLGFALLGKEPPLGKWYY